VEGEDVMKHYYYPSFISLVPHILLEEVEAEYRLVFVNLHGNAHKQPNFLAINPNGLVPVLVDGDLVIYESAAMCLHLADKYPEKELSPAQGSMQRAHFYKWLMWFAATLQPALSMYLHPDKWGSDSSTLIELRLRAESKVSDLFDILDSALEADGGPWLLGNTFSVVDVYALTLCRWSRAMPRPGVSWPRVGPYVHRILERSAVRRALQQENLSEPWV
jgi:glutathione S-transferase